MKTTPKPYLYPNKTALTNAFLQEAESQGLIYENDKPAFRLAFCGFVDTAARGGECSHKVAYEACLPARYYR